MNTRPVVVGSTPRLATQLGADWLDLRDIVPSDVTGRHVLLCPTSDKLEAFPLKLAKWRKEGLLEVRSLGFPTYHGIHWHPLSPRPRGGKEWLGVHSAIDYWVVHSREDALRYFDQPLRLYPSQRPGLRNCPDVEMNLREVQTEFLFLVTILRKWSKVIFHEHPTFSSEHLCPLGHEICRNGR